MAINCKTVKKYRFYNTLYIPYICAPVAVLARIAFLIIVRFMPLLQAYATAVFIDKAIYIVTNQKNISEIAFPVSLFALTILVSNLERVILNLISVYIGNGIRNKYMEFLIEKCAKLPYPYIEDSKIWDLIKRVKNKPDESVQKGFESVINIIGIMIQIVSFAIVFFVQVKWLVIPVFLISFAAVGIAKKAGEAEYAVQREVAENRRKYEYITQVMTERQTVFERSLFRYFDFWQEKWSRFYLNTRRAEQKITIKSLIRMKITSISMVIITFAVTVSLLFPLAEQKITIGIFISMTQVAVQIVSNMSWELSDYVRNFAKYKEYLKDLAEFSNLEEDARNVQLPSKNVPEIKKIEFRNVSFQYEGAQNKTIQNVNLLLEAGKHYSIVGKNGAGKTTLIKLLTGLYTDFEGDILINGESIRDNPKFDLRTMIAVLFQDFAKYEISLRDNLELGNINEFGTKEQLEKIKEVTEFLEFDSVINKLSNGINTNMGKLEKDGQLLSGGEWQKVAMARSLISPATLLVLDEPTAALDPISESLLYEQFEKIAKGKTTLFISHRLGSTRLADEIIVIDKGTVLNQGKHAFLMKNCVLYQDMYEKQRSWYVE